VCSGEGAMRHSIEPASRTELIRTDADADADACSVAFSLPFSLLPFSPFLNLSAILPYRHLSRRLPPPIRLSLCSTAPAW
jgi:hypothetical protein